MVFYDGSGGFSVAGYSNPNNTVPVGYFTGYFAGNPRIDIVRHGQDKFMICSGRTPASGEFFVKMGNISGKHGDAKF